MQQFGSLFLGKKVNLPTGGTGVITSLSHVTAEVTSFDIPQRGSAGGNFTPVSVVNCFELITANQ